jgi:hypothetical protein
MKSVQAKNPKDPDDDIEYLCPDISYSFTSTKEVISPFNTFWTYRPGINTTYTKKHKQALLYIKSISRKIPKINLPIEHNNAEYPVLNAESLNMFGVDYHLEREVFVIGKYAFFRRNNDDRNGTVVYGGKVPHVNVSWHSEVGMDFLEKLNELLDVKLLTKYPQEPTQEEIYQLLRKCEVID